MGGDTRCFAILAEQSKLYTIPSITETLDLACYRDENGRPLLDMSLLGNRDSQMNHKTNPSPMVSQTVEPTFSSIDQYLMKPGARTSWYQMVCQRSKPRKPGISSINRGFQVSRQANSPRLSPCLRTQLLVSTSAMVLLEPVRRLSESSRKA